MAPGKKGMAGKRDIFKRIFTKPETYIFSLYGVITAIMTYPAITLVSKVYAEPRDSLLYIWWTWWFKYSFNHKLPVSPISLVSVPFDYNWSPFAQESLTNNTLRGLSIATNETVAFNLFLLFSFFLAAVATYYLARYLTGSRAGAALSGIVFAFSPFMLMHGKEHINIVTTMWIPIFVWTLIRAWRKRTSASIALCGAVIVVCSMFNSHYGLLSALFFLVFLVVMWVTGKPWRRKKHDWSLVLKALPVVVIVITLLVLLSLMAKKAPRGGSKNIADLYIYSARPWDYFLPTAEGTLFGWATEDLIVSHLHGGFLSENSLFLGYIPLFLAGYGVFAVFRKRKRGEEPGSPSGDGSQGEGDGEARARDDRAPGVGNDRARKVGGGFTPAETRRLVWVLIVCFAAAFITSMPPTARVFGVKLYFPSYVLHKIVPQVRAYTRFGLLVILCTALLAGYAVAEITRRKRIAPRRVLITALLCIIVLLEFTIVPPFYSLDTKKTTDYYRWLEGRPGQPTVAIYPLFFTENFHNYEYFFNQRFHQKKLVNGAQSHTEANYFRQMILDLWHPATPGLLKALDTQYVMVIPSNYEIGRGLNYVYPVDVRSRLSALPEGLEKVKEFEDCLVCEVTAEAAQFIPIFTEGAYQAYMDKQGDFWHPGTSRVFVEINSEVEDPVACDIKFRAMSAGATSTLTAELNEREVASMRLESSPEEFIIRDMTLKPGKNYVVLESDGPLVNLTDVPTYADVAASFMLSNVLVEKK